MTVSGHQFSNQPCYQNLETFLQSNEPQHWELALQLLQSLPEDTQADHNEVLFLDVNGYRQAALFLKHGFVTGLKYLKIKEFYLSRLYSYKIKQFPLVLTHLASLEILDLSNCALSLLPPEIGQMKNLRTLNLSNNQIVQLPPEMGKLKKLEYLNLSGNCLSNLPSEIGQMKSLRNISLSNNQLRILPPEIEQLKKVETFSLDANPITPKEKKRLKKLIKHNTRTARERYWKILIQM